MSLKIKHKCNFCEAGCKVEWEVCLCQKHFEEAVETANQEKKGEADISKIADGYI